MILAKTQQAPTGSDNSSAATSAGEEAVARMPGLSDALFRRCANLLSSDWRIVQWSRKANEAVIASLGPIEIREVPRGCLVETRVKGDMTPARGTALVRLAKYLEGQNRSHVTLG